MKNHLKHIFAIALAIILIITLIPKFTKRIEVEKTNKNVAVSLYYNDIANRLRGKKLDDAIEKFKEIGVTTLSFSEENVNAMVARGDITNIKYNVLKHKYDDESIALAKEIEKKAPDIIYDSQLIITKNDETAKFLRKNFPLRYSSDEYKEIVVENETAGNTTTVFCIYDGTLPTNNIQLGYDEEKIAKYNDMGFDICLIVNLQDSSKIGYISNIQKMTEKYDGIKYLSVRAPIVGTDKESDAKEHYINITKLIDKTDLALVITENANQLSNEKFSGYNIVFNANSDKVLRSYETYDASNSDETHYMFRYYQYLNSTIDRNIRFITVSQIHLEYTPYEQCTEYTLKAVEEYIQKITELGYTVNGEPQSFDYNDSLAPVNAVAAAIMVLMLYLMLVMVFETEFKHLFTISLVIAILGAAVALIMPNSYEWIFPTAWSVLAPCFGMTVVMSIADKLRYKLKTITFVLLITFSLVFVMSVCGIVQSSLLSGINYYVNNDIFRGVKLSLFLPIVYTAAIYIYKFIKIDYKSAFKRIMASDISSLAKIKFSQIIIIAVVAFVVYKIGNIYITRSGNVNSISSIESAMRNFITELFEARPRTKEFLVGYPCLILFAYYFKNTKIKLLNGLLLCGGSITAASISNSFCHVFTSVKTIYGRVINGVIIGAIVCVIIYILNIFAFKLIKKLIDKYIKEDSKWYGLYKTLLGEGKNNDQ